MKIIVVMSCHNRQFQFDNTVVSMERSAVKDVELVVVDDASDPDPQRGPFYVHECWRHRQAHVLKTDPEEKFWTSVPAVPFNRGIQRALDLGADAIVLQSPECRHVGDVLAHVQDHAGRGLYLTYGCLSLSREDTLDPWTFGKERTIGAVYAREASSGGGNGWFNHSVHRPAHLEFCAAIHRDDIIALNGYDERFADGVACGDNDLLRRVRNLGLELCIVDDPFVVHQWHHDGPNAYDDVPRYKRNQDLLARLERDKGYRAVHMFTEDLL